MGHAELLLESIIRGMENGADLRAAEIDGYAVGGFMIESGENPFAVRDRSHPVTPPVQFSPIYT